MPVPLEMIVQEAFDAAKQAETAFVLAYGETMYCGFAWVNIRPGNCNIANYLKKTGKAGKSYSGGVDVWNPGGSYTQSMDVKETGARAFADVLRKYGFNANALWCAD